MALSTIRRSNTARRMLAGRATRNTSDSEVNASGTNKTSAAVEILRTSKVLSTSHKSTAYYKK